MISILRKVACVFVGVLCALCVFDLDFKVKGSFYLHNSHLSSCLSCLLCFWLFYIFFILHFIKFVPTNILMRGNVWNPLIQPRTLFRVSGQKLIVLWMKKYMF